MMFYKPGSKDVASLDHKAAGQITMAPMFQLDYKITTDQQWWANFLRMCSQQYQQQTRGVHHNSDMEQHCSYCLGQHDED